MYQQKELRMKATKWRSRDKQRQKHVLQEKELHSKFICSLKAIDFLTQPGFCKMAFSPFNLFLSLRKT